VHGWLKPLHFRKIAVERVLMHGQIALGMVDAKSTATARGESRETGEQAEDEPENAGRTLGHR
jgi:hypothetical protein